VRVRSEAWLVHIKHILSETGAERVNIIAQSMGGLDARHLISRKGLHEVVATLTTISTPHHGSGAADFVLEQPDRLRTMAVELVNWMGTIALEDATADALTAVTELTPTFMAERFNREVPNHPSVRYWPESEDRDALRRGIRALARLYLAAGAERVYLPHAAVPPLRNETEVDAALSGLRTERYRLTLNSVHPQGSVAMGGNRRTSAVNVHGELWGNPGIFVCDASVFPTSIGVPPQVTIMTLAAATADFIASERL
jgi:choline dehydrogenase-like flavoprotein